MGDDPAPREQAGPRQQEGAAAHGGDPSGALCGATDPGHQPLVLAGQVDAAAADGDQGVDRAQALVEGQGRGDGQPRVGDHRSWLGGHHLDLHLPGPPAGGREHLVGAGQIEDLEARKDDEDDTSSGHPAILSPRGIRRQ